MEASEIRRKVVDLGREMQQKYCLQTRRRSSLMFPPAPCSKFVDKFPEEIHIKKEQKEYNQQVQYEGEVKFYRILENMNIGALVIHGFSITHKMFKLYSRNHSDECNRKDQEEEGECVFTTCITVYNLYNYMTILNMAKLIKLGKPSFLVDIMRLDTLGRNNRVFLPLLKCKQYQLNFCFQGPKLWNLLASKADSCNDITNALTISTIKSRLKKFLLLMQSHKHSNNELTWNESNNSIFKYFTLT